MALRIGKTSGVEAEVVAVHATVGGELAAVRPRLPVGAVGAGVDVAAHQANGDALRAVAPCRDVAAELELRVVAVDIHTAVNRLRFGLPGLKTHPDAAVGERYWLPSRSCRGSAFAGCAPSTGCRDKRQCRRGTAASRA